MLAVEHYPQIAFRSISIHKIDNDHYEVQGALTIRDVTKPATAMVVLRAGARGLPVIEGTSRIRLTDFGLKPPTAALGTIGTKNEMSFRFVVAAAE
jgi:polyisoprenoid-binding protein YceI